MAEQSAKQSPGVCAVCGHPQDDHRTGGYLDGFGMSPFQLAREVVMREAKGNTSCIRMGCGCGRYRRE